jgi:hypothetical protein
MNYPTEFDELVQEIEARKFLKQNSKKRCSAAENGGCFCTGWCEDKPQSDKLAYTNDVEGEV